MIRGLWRQQNQLKRFLPIGLNSEAESSHHATFCLCDVEHLSSQASRSCPNLAAALIENAI